MSDKTSQKTEEEMLDQTFGGYDEEMTVQTESVTSEDGTVTSKSTTVTKKPMNQNLIIGGVVGIAALGIIGMKFAGGNSNQQQVQPPAPVVIAPVVTAPVQPPVDIATTAPVTSPVPPNALVNPTPVQPPVDTSPAAQYLSGANPLTPNKTDKVEVAKVETTTTTVTPAAVLNPTPVEPVITPVEPVKTVVKTETIKTDVTNNPNVAAMNASQSGLTNELKSLFDRQTQELKGALETVGSRVGKLENSNRSIEDRLTRLESGKATRNVKTEVVTNTESVTSNTPVVKHVKHVVKHKPVKKYIVKTPVETDGVLVDKTEHKVIVIKTEKIEKSETVYPNIEVHSIYGGRVWTKNTDGSLSTYAVGERLPDGEIIRTVDEDKHKVTTDKRVLTK